MIAQLKFILSPFANAQRLFCTILICSITTICLAENPFGHFTVNRGAWNDKIPDANWDRGVLKINQIQKVGDTYEWTHHSSLNSGFCGDGLNEMPNDRNWVLWLELLPSWLQSNLSRTPNDWYEYEDLLKWVVAQLPEQVKVIEIANESYYWGPKKVWKDATTMAEYIKRTSRAIHAVDPTIIVAGPVWTDPGPYNQIQIASLASIGWSDGTHTLDWLDAISMHNYYGEDEASNAEEKFSLWHEQLDNWYRAIQVIGYGHLPTYWTEFGWPIPHDASIRIVTRAEQARLVARGLSILKAKEASGIIVHCLSGENGSANDYALCELVSPTGEVHKPSYDSAAFTMSFLKDTGKGLIVNDGTRCTIDFGDRLVIWDSNFYGSLNVGFTIKHAYDMNGNQILVTNGNTVTIGPDPIFLTKIDSNN